MVGVKSYLLKEFGMKYKECATCKYHDGKTCMFCENAKLYKELGDE